MSLENWGNPFLCSLQIAKCMAGILFCHAYISKYTQLLLLKFHAFFYNGNTAHVNMFNYVNLIIINNLVFT